MSQPKSNEEIVEAFIEKFGDNITANTPWGVQEIEDEMRDCLSKLLAQKDAEVAEAAQKQKAMFARHIDEIMKVINNPHELVDWLVFYKNTLTPKE